MGGSWTTWGTPTFCLKRTVLRAVFTVTLIPLPAVFLFLFRNRVSALWQRTPTIPPSVPASKRHNATKWCVTVSQGEAMEPLIISCWGSYCVEAAERGRKERGTLGWTLRRRGTTAAAAEALKQLASTIRKTGTERDRKEAMRQRWRKGGWGKVRRDRKEWKTSTLVTHTCEKCSHLVLSSLCTEHQIELSSARACGSESQIKLLLSLISSNVNSEAQHPRMCVTFIILLAEQFKMGGNYL